MDRERVIRVPTTGVFDFESLVTDETKKYVDKTDLLYELAKPKTDSQLFISRPRRFGKSLMLSTLKAMFEGRRDLFKGLAIDKLPWEGWTRPTPVYSFTMSKVVGETYELFMAQLAKLVRCLCVQAGVPYVGDGAVSGQFDDFLQAAAEKSPTKKIVVLIDEYDEPVAKRYFLLFMKLIGADISGERQSARGRADAVLGDKSGVYVFEFKYGKSAKEALAQARTKEYAGPWLDGNPPVFYVGVNYDPERRGVDDPLVEPA